MRILPRTVFYGQAKLKTSKIVGPSLLGATAAIFISLFNACHLPNRTEKRDWSVAARIIGSKSGIESDLLFWFKVVTYKCDV